MIYLNELALKSGEFSVFEKLRILTLLDHYLAENVDDYIDNSEKISIPSYKRFRARNPAIIHIKNVGIDLIQLDGKDKGIFSIHDHTGKNIVFWGDNDLVEPAIFFSQAKEMQGLENEDWVYSVSLCYFTGLGGHAYLVDIQKNKFSRPSKKKLSGLVERLLPDFQPAIQPSY